MKPPRFEQYEANLHILTPVHVGTGIELDPFSYVVRDETLYMIDLMKWVESGPDREDLLSIVESNSYVELRSFIAERFDSADCVRNSIAVDCPELIRVYESAVKDRNPRNQVLISPMIRNEIDMKAFIPGSSLKGAIRTALASSFVENAGVQKRDVKGKYGYDAKIFGPFQKDVMKYFKAADVAPAEVATVVVEARELPLDPDKSPTPKGYFEVFPSLCHAGRPVVLPALFSLADFSIRGRRIDIGFLLEALNNFYVPKYVEEYRKFYKGKRAERIQLAVVPANRQVASLKSNEALVRIGHFSHVECVTLDKVRNPKTRKGKYGGTRTLANGLFPFGWAKIEFPGFAARPRMSGDFPLPLRRVDVIGNVATDPAGFAPVPKPFGAKPPKKRAPAHALKPELPDKADQPIKPAPPEPPEPITKTPVEKLLDELAVINSTDMGRLGTVKQKIDGLETAAEKAEVASALKEKIGKRAFKKSKWKQDLLAWIEAGGKAG